MEKKLNFREMENSNSYEAQKQIIRKEINWGDPKKEYFADRSVFKKDDKEKTLLANLKAEWRKEVRLQGVTSKRKIPIGVNGTVKTNQ